LSNKREIWRAASKLRNWRHQARQIVSLQEVQRAEKEKQLVGKLNRLGVLAKDAKIDDILALSLRSILDRRLQSLIYTQGFVNSIKQARQFILHGKVIVNDKVITAPSYVVESADKIKLIEGFAPKVKKVIKLKKPEEPAETVKPVEISKEASDKQVVEDLALKATKEAKV